MVLASGKCRFSRLINKGNGRNRQLSGEHKSADAKIAEVKAAVRNAETI